MVANMSNVFMNVLKDMKMALLEKPPLEIIPVQEELQVNSFIAMHKYKKWYNKAQKFAQNQEMTT